MIGGGEYMQVIEKKFHCENIKIEITNRCQTMKIEKS